MFARTILRVSIALGYTQESLGGNARTSLVVAVADAMEHADETFNSLQFGTRAMFMENQVPISRLPQGCQLPWTALVD